MLSCHLASACQGQEFVQSSIYTDGWPLLSHIHASQPSRHIHRENRCKLTMENISEPSMMFQDQSECGVRYLSLWYGCSSVPSQCIVGIVGWQFCGMMILVPVSLCRSGNALMMSNIISVIVWIQNLDDHDDDNCQQVHTIVRVCERCYPAELLVK